MAKIADEYFQVEPWRIVEKGFDPGHSEVGESIFSLANEYMGIRGFFEEGYSGDSLIGSYFNGVYITEDSGPAQYKGVSHISEFMVNSVNWLKTCIVLDGEILDLNTSKFEDFERVLNLKNGLLTRSFTWISSSGKKTELTFERLLSMEHVSYGVQRITVKPINYSGELEISLSADFGIYHESTKKNYWNLLDTKQEPGITVMQGITTWGEKEIRTTHTFTVDGKYEENKFSNHKEAGKTFILHINEGEPATVTRVVNNNQPGKNEDTLPGNVTFERLLKDSESWWGEVWKTSDIVIEGDEKNQQGIRFCIFQMVQTYHGAYPGDNIGAKGLTGEAYAGCAFWDTETYCLPFYMLNLPHATESLLEYRYNTLDMARERAKALDCEGAFYPVSTISGRESCRLWQHASLQMQASTGVAYGIWFYEKLTDDVDFLKRCGAEMLVEVSRMLATRGDWSADGSYYGYYCVMGPDEFQMMVNHNCYTNYMGKFTMEYTLEVLERLEKDANWYADFVKRLSLTEDEKKDWKEKAAKMRIIKKGNLYEQHDGFFNLPHVDVDAIPVTDFPLYNHWSYDRLYRNDMIKQPDVLMLMLLFNQSFSEEELEENYAYYEPKCIHESSLSPSVHSILAAQIGKEKEAYDFFGFATRLDLDDYNRNTREGLHTTSIAAAWMNIVYGFGGVRTDGDILTVNPTIPESWGGYQFHLIYKGVTLLVKVGKESSILSVENGEKLEIVINGEKKLIEGSVEVPLRKRG